MQDVYSRPSAAANAVVDSVVGFQVSSPMVEKRLECIKHREVYETLE